MAYFYVYSGHNLLQESGFHAKLLIYIGGAIVRVLDGSKRTGRRLCLRHRVRVRVLTATCFDSKRKEGFKIRLMRPVSLGCMRVQE